jgi:HlyD family secretion protein
MVVLGTMNNPGTVILTIADMSIIEAEVEVDETDIPSIVLGQKAKIKIDAIPDKTFTGSVTEIGNSPIQATSAAAAGQQATNFKVVVTLDGQIPEVRPGFTCTADITTATRKGVTAVPIQATTSERSSSTTRATSSASRWRRARAGRGPAAQAEPADRHARSRGCSSFATTRSSSTIGHDWHAGEKFFEVLSGVKEGDAVVVGLRSASVR